MVSTDLSRFHVLSSLAFTQVLAITTHIESSPRSDNLQSSTARNWRHHVGTSYDRA